MMTAKKHEEAQPQIKMPKTVVRLPVEMDQETMTRFYQAMGKEFPGWNRSEVVRKLIKDFCDKAGF